MADVFKMLLEGAQKTRVKRDTNDKLKSILNNPESLDYGNRKKGKTTDDMYDDFSDYDFNIGEEKDKIDHLSDFPKISLKELDKKSAKDQLKILKIEYNRLYDKLIYLNDSISNNERLISDLQMGKRSDEEEVKEMKNLIRKVIHLFPGNTQLKDTLDRGSWNGKDVYNLIEDMIISFLKRVKQTERIIEDEVGQVKKENSSLKEKILQYKQYFNKITELEDFIMQQQAGLQMQNQNIPSSPVQTRTNADINSEAPKPVPEPEPKIDVKNSTQKNNEILAQSNKRNNNTSNTFEQNTVEHNPHFSDFFSEFKSSFSKMKESESKNVEQEPPTFAKTPSPPPPVQPSISVNQLSNFETNSNNAKTVPSKHPLSPDYIETEKEEVDDLFDTTIEAYLQNLSVQQEYLLTVIGKTGISRNSDLKEYLKNDSLGQQYYFVGKKYNSNALNRDVSELRDKGILSDEQISYGGKGGGTFNVYELSKTGKSCFKMITSENPLVSEKKRIVGIHASLEHGYLIKDSANIFRELNYKVYTDLDDVSIKIDSKHRKVFDFIVEDEEGKLQHIEVEMGTHTQEDFSKAMDKIYEITKDFYFICPNENIKNKNTKKKFFTWVTKSLGGIQNADVILYMTTIEQLRKKTKNIWEVTDLRKVK